MILEISAAVVILLTVAIFIEVLVMCVFTIEVVLLALVTILKLWATTPAPLTILLVKVTFLEALRLLLLLW